MGNQKIIFFAILFISLLAISTVSASEIDDDIDLKTVDDNNHALDAGEIDDSDLEITDFQLEDKNNEDILTAGGSGTFTDLANEIENADGELTLTRNYFYSNSN